MTKENLAQSLAPLVSEKDHQTAVSVLQHAEQYMYPPLVQVNPADHSSELVELPYHNFDHALTVAKSSLTFCGQLVTRGASIDVAATVIAAITHDAHFQEGEDLDLATKTLKQRGLIAEDAPILPNKETLSQIRTAELLESYGFAAQRIQNVSGIIVATAASETPATLEERIVSRADLQSIAGNSEEFFANTRKLLEEHALLRGQPLDLPTVIAGMKAALEQLLAPDISFGEYEEEYETVFRIPALNNVARLGREVVRGSLQDILRRLP